MKVYFLGSIKGKNKYLRYYELIVNELRKQGHTVVENTLNPEEDYVYSLDQDEKVAYYKKITGWINSADVIVAEVSYQSLSLGHEVTLAVEREKPVILLYTGGNEPHLLQGMTSDKMIISQYDESDVAVVLRQLLGDARDQMDVRFNFFVSPQIVSYLDWISQKRRMPRAVFLRRIIEEEMEANQDYAKENF
jgi:hypothetical protein